MKRDLKEKRYLRPLEVAELLMVSPITVRQWAQKGSLEAETTLGGHRRFLRENIENFARRHGLALQPSGQDGLRILVVDDDNLVTESLVAFFEEIAPTVVTEIAHDGFDAGTKVLSFRPHVVLLDLVMPGLDGHTVCDRLKRDPATKAIRVIAMTAYHTVEATRRIVVAGAETCLSKPLDMDVLLDSIGLRQRATAIGRTS